MRTRFRLLGAAALLAVAAGCALPRVPVAPPPALLFAQYKAPLTPDLHDTPVGSKRGIAKTFFVFEPFLGTMWAWEDASIKTAAANGRISKIYYADYEAFTVLNIFGRFTVVAYGD